MEEGTANVDVYLVFLSDFKHILLFSISVYLPIHECFRHSEIKLSLNIEYWEKYISKTMVLAPNFLGNFDHLMQ